MQMGPNLTRTWTQFQNFSSNGSRQARIRYHTQFTWKSWLVRLLKRNTKRVKHHCSYWVCNSSVTFFLSVLSCLSDNSSHKTPTHADGSDFDSEPHLRRNQILSALFAFGAMLGYAILTGIVSIDRVQPQRALQARKRADDEEADWASSRSSFSRDMSAFTYL